MAVYACIEQGTGYWCGFKHRDRAKAAKCCAGALSKENIARKPRGFATSEEVMALPITRASYDRVLGICSTYEKNLRERLRQDGKMNVVGETVTKDTAEVLTEVEPTEKGSPETVAKETAGATGLEQLLGMHIKIEVAKQLAESGLSEGAIQKAIAEIEGGLTKTVMHEVTINGEPVETAEGEFLHANYKDVAEMHGAREDFALIGPTGCGKTHLIRQFAEKSEIRWGSISCSEGMSEGQLLGRERPTPGGAWGFIGTSFLECYEKGGIFLVGEADGADANVLLALNNALANGFLPIPLRKDAPVAERHEDFVCAIDMNTFGRGGNRMYVRNRLDAAFLDRFLEIEMDYDRGLEKNLVPSDDEWLNWAWSVRDAAESLNFARSVSTRKIEKIANMRRKAGWDLNRAKQQLVGSWTPDERQRLRSKGVAV